MRHLQTNQTDGRCNNQAIKDDNPKFAALLAESEESRSKYKDPASDDSQPKMETDDEPICEEGLKLEDEEPNTNIQLKMSKKRKGVVAQDQISAVVVAIDVIIDDKQSPRNHGTLKEATASHPLQSGFIPNWQKVQHIQPQAIATGTGSVLHRKCSGLSGTSEVDTCSDSINSAQPPSWLRSDHTSSHAASSNAGAVSYGGFVPEDKEEEFAEMHNLKLEGNGQDKKLALRYKVCWVQSLLCMLTFCSGTSLSQRSRTFT